MREWQEKRAIAESFLLRGAPVIVGLVISVREVLDLTNADLVAVLYGAGLTASGVYAFFRPYFGCILLGLLVAPGFFVTIEETFVKWGLPLLLIALYWFTGWDTEQRKKRT